MHTTVDYWLTVNNNCAYINNDGEKPMNTWETLRTAYESYKQHTGGQHAGWCRMMARNSYTIDPAEPAPDALDEERAALKAAALAAALTYISECTNGVTNEHQVRYFYPGLPYTISCNG